ncbi:hypothetical protein MAM1_0148c06586 [Mucor ambiguus]|uniref:Uncharacterized protein n=1 Tax=Mucor ambiguus TaxID=91626 RepID=A0A0C9LVN7_9FUNG|nr:hypothetical protein MAM1_0148c06586 [Mucor ambiguus]
MSLTTTLNTNKIAQSKQDFYPKVQPRSSAERDNSILLHSALKAASTDMAHRLLDYASLDKTDCEASCILIALANHEPFISRSNKTSESNGETTKAKQPDQDEMDQESLSNKQASQGVTQTNDKKSQQKNDPIMLLMAAAEVVDRQSDSDEKKKRYSYPSRYYHRKSDEWTPQHKRMRTSPPTSPAPSYKPDTWRKNSSRSHSKSDNKSSTKVAQANNSFSRQYHSMKQNPKIKQNALHTYITYMIYNDLAHGGGTHQNGKTNAMTTSTFANGAIEKNHQTNAFESVNTNSMPAFTASSSSVSPNYYKQAKQRNDHLHHRPYAGDALHNSPGSNSSMRSVSTPADVNSHSQLTTSSTTTGNTSDSKSTVSSLSSPWYPPANHSPLNARSSSTPSAPPPPPTLHDERSILSRPLTAFLWDKDDKPSPISTPKKDMMILPPLSSAKASPSPNNFDRLKSV